MELVGVGDRGALVEEVEPGLLEDGEDDGVAGVEDGVGHQLVHGSQGQQSSLEVGELLRDLQLVYIKKNLGSGGGVRWRCQVEGSGGGVRWRGQVEGSGGGVR